jgi:hypothetical protein
MATSTDLRAAIEEVQQQLPGEQVAGGLDGLYRPDWLSGVERRIGALPWWVISAVVHSVIFLLATLLTVAMPPAQVDEVVISTDVARQEEQKYDEKLERDIFRQKAEIQDEQEVEKPVLVHEEAPISDHFETANDMDSNSARGSEDAISDIPMGGTDVVGSMGVGGGGMAGCFGYRDGGGRRRAVKRFGGSKATESAVEAALAWLARHQEPTGDWDLRKGGGSGNGLPYRIGASGLALLAFLGAGYTHKSGKYRDNVKRAQDWLMKQQEAEGNIFRGYSHAIAGLALAEAYGMTQDPELKEAAQKAVTYSTQVHQKPYSAWRYRPKVDPDISVTGWFVMQLKSAKVAGLKVDGAGFQGAQNFLDKVTRPEEGTCGYMGAFKGISQTSIGLVCRLFMGARNSDKLMVNGSKFLTDNHLPSWEGNVRGNTRTRTFYYWYYGTLAMFQMGGDTWKQWNPAMKKTLVPHQRKGGPLDGSVNDVDGSWDPIDKTDKAVGRVYTTALGALTLEVYYRYLPMYTK